MQYFRTRTNGFNRPSVINKNKYILKLSGGFCCYINVDGLNMNRIHFMDFNHASVN